MLATLFRSGSIDGAPPENGRARVLVADDSLEMARSVADGLRDRGYDATAVASGREALDRLSREPFDALVTDLRMPEIDGLAVIAGSRSLDPNRPVIAMTGYSSVDIALESLRQGAYQYLMKPFKQEELAIFLGRALDQARMKRAARALRDSDGEFDRAAATLGVDMRTLHVWLTGRD